MTDADRIAAIVRKAEDSCCNVTIDEIRWLADRAAVDPFVAVGSAIGAEIHRRSHPAPLTVGAALALPEVQRGSCVVETPATGERCAEQLRLRQSGRLSSREYDRGRWGDWFASSDLSTAPLPCRIVPLDEADANPATRGEMP